MDNVASDSTTGVTLHVAPALFYPTLQSTARTIVHQGGQWSGKTVQILMVLAVKAANNRNMRITVTGQTLPHLKSGAYRDFEMFVYPGFEGYIKQWNKSDNIFYFKNGSFIEFKVFDSEIKAAGSKRDYLYVNEANGVEYGVFWQLNSRTEIQTIIDYNPSQPFWAHEKLIGKHGVQLFISDHRHNPFLSAERHAEIEGELDENLFRVYGRGLTGNTQGVIYPAWRRIADADFPDFSEFAPQTGGLDFGYTNDPTAPVAILRHKEAFYVKELAYAPGIDMKAVKEYFAAGGITGQPVYSDHDNDNISLLRRHGMNIFLAKKSIHPGILFLKKQKIYYPESSLNIHKERMKYVFIRSKETGELTNTPIDKHNHLMDSIRYGIFSHYMAS